MRLDHFYVCEELENSLINYQYGRKTNKHENAPQSHAAATSKQYVNTWKSVHKDNSDQLYSLLCQAIHPGYLSVLPHLRIEEIGSDTILNLSFNEAEWISDVAAKYKHEINVLISQLNLPFLTLKVLHKFDVFPKISELRDFDLSYMPAWSRIKTSLYD